MLKKIVSVQISLRELVEKFFRLNRRDENTQYESTEEKHRNSSQSIYYAKRY